MNQGMQIGPRHEVLQQLEQMCELALQQVGGATDSVFPRTEALLLAHAEFQQGLVYIGSKRRISEYRSMMDFVFCEATGKYKAQCRSFYEDRGPPLRDILSPEQIAFYDPWLAAACAVSAWLYRQQKPWAGWPNMRKLIMAHAKVSIANSRIHINLTAR